MQIKIDRSDVERLKNDLRHINDGMPLVVMRSINRVLTGVRTDFVTSVRREYNVKARAARKNIRLRKASK
ncbi:MAG: phage tail protein, partial [Desulfosalsimonas sp.]